MSGRVKNFHRNAQPVYRRVRAATLDPWGESERLASAPSQVSVNHDAGSGRLVWNGKRLELVVKDSFLEFLRRPREVA